MMIHDRLLRKNEIAERLSLSWQAASRLLAERGVLPVDFGRGRGNGPRWLESSVDAVVHALYMEAQPKPKKERRPPRSSILPSMPLHKMPASAAYDFLMQEVEQGRAVQ